jgi:hypothetical protein
MQPWTGEDAVSPRTSLSMNLAGYRFLYSVAQFVIRQCSGMIHRYLAGSVQDDQRRCRTCPVGIEVLFAQRNRHVLKAAVVSGADGFDVCALLLGRCVGSLGCVAVELGWTDDDQARGSELLPQAGDDGDLGFAVHTPMGPEEKKNWRTFQRRGSWGLGSEILGYL